MKPIALVAVLGQKDDGFRCALPILRARFEEHKRVAYGRSRSAVYTWLHREWKCGYPVQCILLQECSDIDARRVETERINKFPNLLNERKYYFRHCKPPVIPAIKDYMRRFRFSSGGFRGIHWWRELDRYSVFVYTGDDWEWLLGDGAPGWTGNIWFSHRTEALKARHKYKQGEQRNWLPDFETALDSPDMSLDFDSSIDACECDVPLASEFGGTIARLNRNRMRLTGLSSP